MATANERQPDPTTNASRAIWPLLIEEVRFGSYGGDTPEKAHLLADMAARDAFGRAHYGTPLQAGNGRDALIDAYQEALDLCVYLRQAKEEGVLSETTGLIVNAVGIALALRFNLDCRTNETEVG